MSRGSYNPALASFIRATEVELTSSYTITVLDVFFPTNKHHVDKQVVFALLLRSRQQVWNKL